MACEVTVKIKDKVSSVQEKFKFYEPVTADLTDPKIDELLHTMNARFRGDLINAKTTVTIKIVED